MENVFMSIPKTPERAVEIHQQALTSLRNLINANDGRSVKEIREVIDLIRETLYTNPFMQPYLADFQTLYTSLENSGEVDRSDEG